MWSCILRTVRSLNVHAYRVPEVRCPIDISLSTRCLGQLARSVCPLCRAEFEPSNIRKLHVDIEPTAEGNLVVASTIPTNAIIAFDDSGVGEMALLRRLMLTWELSSDDAERIVVMSEVNEWFEAQCHTCENVVSPLHPVD